MSNGISAPRYDVSRTVVREALRHLEAQGLIEIVPNRGPVVARVSAEEATWLFEVRAALEALAGQCFAERATAADKDALTAAIEQVRRQMDVSDMATLLAAKDHFYDVLLDGSGNPIIASMLRPLHARIRLLRGLSLGAPGRLDDTLIELDAIRAAIMDGDGEGTARACRLHVHLKKTVLELGGSDPFVVMPSADVAAAARTAAASRCQNNGQSCIAAKRFIVHHDAYEEFLDAFVQAMSALVVDDPLAATTDVGPLATERGRAELVELVADATAKGATVRCGGARPDRPGWWYPPTVLTDVSPGMRLYGEEAFGPVAAVHRVADYTEAVSLTNGTAFGLGANAWTTDPDEQEAFIADLEAGAVFVNGMVASHPALPFGGVKNSGYGTELSDLGLREFCTPKAVWVR